MPVVEFLGIPGSGKSTLARELTGSLGDAISLEEAVRISIADHGEDAVTRTAARLSRSASSRLWRTAYGRSSDRLAALTRFLAAHPTTLETVLAAQRQRDDRDRGQEMVLGWVLNLMSRYELATASVGNRWLVIDEGFCQRAVAIFSHGFSPADEPLLDDYMSAIPLPDVAVVVETPLDIARERLEKRGWSERVRDLDGEARLRVLESSVSVVGSVITHLERTMTRVIRVDGTGPVPDSLIRVSATLTG